LQDDEYGRVRPMAVADLDRVMAWRNHERIRSQMRTSHLVSRQEHAQWFERCSQQPDRHLLIFEQRGEPSGFVNFHVASTGRIFEWGFYAAPESTKGTGTRMGVTALRHARQALQAHKVCGEVLAFNERSIAYHLRLGFTQEGVLREQHFDGTRYHDVVCFGLLMAAWQDPLTK
jgi:UDP-4-amino-4,6-dideoxy-N-acetyl-beta-L-altrosamine N-acetyltransferase